MNDESPAPVTVESVECGDVDPDSFDHEAHVYAAWLFLDTYPAEEAETANTTGTNR